MGGVGKKAYLFSEAQDIDRWFCVYALGESPSVYPIFSAGIRVRDLMREGYQIIYRNVPFANLLQEPDRYREINNKDIKAFVHHVPELRDLLR